MKRCAAHWVLLGLVGLFPQAGCGGRSTGLAPDAGSDAQPGDGQATLDASSPEDAVAPDAAVNLPVGAPCLAPGDCTGNWCLVEAEGWPDGYCTQVGCNLATPGLSCIPFGGDGFCVDVGAPGQPQGLCVDRCALAAGDDDCRDGYECLDVRLGSGQGLCLPLPVCGNGTVERGEECEPPGVGNCDADCIGLGAAPVGDPCGTAADCAGNWCFPEAEGWPEGYCTQYGCDLGSPATSCAPYGGDGLCIDVGEEGAPSGLCFDRCSVAAGDADCRSGYQCRDLRDGTGSGVCFPAPVCGNGTVEWGEECEPPGVGNCDASCQGLGAAPVGAPCATAADCAGSWCITDGDGWPDGYCTDLECDLASPETSCASALGDGYCLDTGSVAEPYGVCFDSCDPAQGDTDCRAEYECVPRRDGSALGLCFPAPVCGNGVVERGEECEPPGVGNCDASCQGLGSAPVGDPCGTAADCAGNWCIAAASGWPGGYCTDLECDLASPETSCAAAGGDGYCMDVGDGGQASGMCFDTCDPDQGNADCRTGYECVDLRSETGHGFCLPEPVCGNGVVERGEECEPPGTSSCDASCQGLGTAPVGDPCATAADCDGNWCISEADGWPLGYCTHYGCDTTQPLSACAGVAGDARCVNVGTEQEPFGLCLDACTPFLDPCRTGYRCQLGGVALFVCVPD